MWIVIEDMQGDSSLKNKERLDRSSKYNFEFLNLALISACVDIIVLKVLEKWTSSHEWIRFI